MESNDKTNSQIKDKSYWPLLIIGVIVIAFAPWLFTTAAHFKCFDFTGTGEIGDTIGGITAPLVGTLGAVLVYLSFREQRKANQIQWEALKNETLNNVNEKKIDLILNYFNNEIKNKLNSDNEPIISDFNRLLNSINIPSDSKLSENAKKNITDQIRPFYRYIRLFNYCLSELHSLHFDNGIKIFISGIILDEFEQNLKKITEVFYTQKERYQSRLNLMEQDFDLLYLNLVEFNNNILRLVNLYYSARTSVK